MIKRTAVKAVAIGAVAVAVATAATTASATTAFKPLCNAHYSLNEDHSWEGGHLAYRWGPAPTQWRVVTADWTTAANMPVYGWLPGYKGIACALVRDP